MDRKNDTRECEENPNAFPDLNCNGIPDYKEPWLYRLGFNLVVREIKKHPHTLGARALAKLEDLVRFLKGEK